MAAVETTALLGDTNHARRRSAVVSTAGSRASSPECGQGGGRIGIDVLARLSPPSIARASESTIVGQSADLAVTVTLIE